MIDSDDRAEIIRRARQRWMRDQLPRLIFIVHMMLFIVGSFAILAASQELWARLGFPPGWLILGWLGLVIVHYGGTTIWRSYHRAIDREIEHEEQRRAAAWAAEKRKRESPAPVIGLSDDGELVELDSDDSEDRLFDEPQHQQHSCQR